MSKGGYAFFSFIIRHSLLEIHYSFILFSMTAFPPYPFPNAAVTVSQRLRPGL
jgi:hypothetical protein